MLVYLLAHPVRLRQRQRPLRGEADVALGGVHFVPVDMGDLNDAALLRESSSPCCFFASACRSLQVNFLAPPATGFVGEDDSKADCCAIFSKGLTSFLGAESWTGTQFVPLKVWRKIMYCIRIKQLTTGPILSSSRGFVVAGEECAGVDSFEGAGADGFKYKYIRLTENR